MSFAIDGESSADRSGYSVSLNNSGNIVAIGAPFNDGGAADGGHVRAFEWNGSNWNQMLFDINGTDANGRLGSSVSVNDSGNIMAIGAPVAGSLSRGVTKIYSWNGTVWNQMGDSISGIGAAGENSGDSVSINGSGNRVVDTSSPS